MLHNIKFTELINDIYGMNLKICPLNLSQSILINQPTYANRINNIYFDLEHNSNDEINAWFNFILYMFDEQLFFSISRIPYLDRAFRNIESMKDTDNPDFANKVNSLHIRKVRKRDWLYQSQIFLLLWIGKFV